MGFLSLFSAKSIILRIWKRMSWNKIKLKKKKMYWIHLGKINIFFQKNYQAKILILKNLCYPHTSFRKIKNKEGKMVHSDFNDQWQELKPIKKMILQILMILPWCTMISSLSANTIKIDFLSWETVFSLIIIFLRIMQELNLEVIKCKFYKTRNSLNSKCNR